MQHFVHRKHTHTHTRIVRLVKWIAMP